MKDQYAGDIGDYTKLGILRALEKAGFSIGLNWYLTPDDEDKKDGRFIGYLDKQCDTSDNTLFEALRDTVKVKQTRTVEALMRGGLFENPNTAFYSDVLDLASGADRKQRREQWHKRALDALQDKDIVFLDPDNAFIPKAISPYSKAGNKYVTYEEAADYFKAGASVIIYNHKAMFSKEGVMVERLRRIANYVSIDLPSIFCLKAPRHTVRYYLFLVQPDHLTRVEVIIANMLSESTGWRKYLGRMPLFEPQIG